MHIYVVAIAILVLIVFGNQGLQELAKAYVGSPSHEPAMLTFYILGFIAILVFIIFGGGKKELDRVILKK